MLYKYPLTPLSTLACCGISCHSFSSPITHSCASCWLIRPIAPAPESFSPPSLVCCPDLPKKKKKNVEEKIRKTKMCCCSFVAFLSAATCNCLSPSRSLVAFLSLFLHVACINIAHGKLEITDGCRQKMLLPQPPTSISTRAPLFTPTFRGDIAKEVNGKVYIL